MAGRIVSFDLDALLAKAKVVAEEAPSLLTMAEAAGWAGASKLTPFVPMLGPLAMFMSKIAGGQDGLTSPALPDTGPRGRGRLNYLLHRNDYDDSAVVKAAELITASGLPAARSVVDQVNLVCRAMFPDTPKGAWDDSQTRRAIDHILTEDGLPEGTTDKLGDLIHFALNMPNKGQP